MDEQTESLVGQLPRRPGGYRPDDVGALVGRLNDTLADAEARAGALRSRLSELEATRTAQRARESRLRDILLEAQHEARELQERGEAERDELLSTARRAAAERREELESERVGLRSSLGELEAFERTLRLRCRFLFEQALNEMPSEEPGASVPVPDPLVANGRAAAAAEEVPIPEAAPPEAEVTEEIDLSAGAVGIAGAAAAAAAPGESAGDEPNTEESAVPVEPVDESLVTYEEPAEASSQPAEPDAGQSPAVAATPALLSSEGEDRIRILSRPEPAADAPPTPGAEQPPRHRGLLVALAIVFAIGGIVAALAVLLTGDGTSTPSSAVVTEVTTGGGAPATESEPASTAPAGEGEPTSTPATAEEEPATSPETTEEPVTEQTPPAAPAAITLSMAATGGDCWLEVRKGSASGTILFQGFLLQGESQTFEGKKLWARMGQPSSLTVKIDGKPAKGLPGGTADVMFTADGVEVVGVG